MSKSNFPSQDSSGSSALTIIEQIENSLREDVSLTSKTRALLDKIKIKKTDHLYNTLNLLISYNALEPFEYLLKKAKTSHQLIPLFSLIAEKDRGMLVSKIVDIYGPNITDELGRTLLFNAAGSGNVAIVKLLIDRKANLNIKDTFDGDTALLIALKKSVLK